MPPGWRLRSGRAADDEDLDTWCAPLNFGDRGECRAVYTAPVLARYGDPGSYGSDNAPVARRHTPLILGADTPRAHAELTDSAGLTHQINYEATASVSGAPMIMRILIMSRDSNRDTCIWLVPISSAISAWERCS